MDNQNTTMQITNTTTEQSLYERDFYQWGLYNAELLKQGRLSEIDIENIAEELESMSRRDKRELASRLERLITHLLKWQYQQNKRSTSWIKTINTQRREINRLLKDSPSLKYGIEVIVNEEFKNSSVSFQKETNISKNILPIECPYTFEQLSDYDFLPE
ncbi:MAG: DUF29 domain-containing protein [Candidatus Magnetoovum sp. WYHC-5]|nr:DUF29 domain-containing protein [Candidatus Magnetoovum sp. WYHC-5]